MEFILDSVPRFYASVGEDRVALLCRSTVVRPLVASSAQDTHRTLGMSSGTDVLVT